jgi:hypothetical protein
MPAAVAVCVLAAASAIYIGHRSGPVAGVAVLAGGALAVLLLSSGRFAVATFLVVGIVAEESADWGFKPFASLYNHVPSPFEALEAIAVVAVLLHLVRTRQPLRIPRPFGGALLLAAIALVAGLLQGLTTGTAPRSSYISTIQTSLPILIVPILVANVVRTPAHLRTAIGIGLALAGFKAIVGLFMVISGIAPNNIGLGRLTYYLPTANLLMMLFLLGMLVARLSGTPVPRWANWLVPVVFAAVVLNYRRTIWLGTGLAALLLVFPAAGRVGRRLIVPAACVIALVGYWVLGTGVAGELQGPLVNRVSSINLGQIQRSQQDRYRIAERQNVWAAIERSPLTGIGIGTEWPTRYPLSFEYPGGHVYAHIGVLWWWMKMGLLGLAAYLVLVASAIVTGVRVWRRHPDAQIRAFGLAAVGLTVGLIVVELGSSVIGSNERGTVLFGAVLGLLASASMQLGARGRADLPDSLASR